MGPMSGCETYIISRKEGGIPILLVTLMHCDLSHSDTYRRGLTVAVVHVGNDPTENFIPCCLFMQDINKITSDVSGRGSGSPRAQTSTPSSLREYFAVWDKTK
jgi:hypothetical protein